MQILELVQVLIQEQWVVGPLVAIAHEVVAGDEGLVHHHPARVLQRNGGEEVKCEVKKK